MRLGKEALQALKAQITGEVKSGDELVVAGAAALGGTTLLVREKYEFLRSFFSEGFLFQSLNLESDYGVGANPWESPAWKIAEKAGANAFYAMGEGGFLSALWKMAEAGQVGLTANLRAVPVRQETIEVCELFNLNPYRLFSRGALLIGVPGGEALVQEYRCQGIMAAVIGQTNSGNDRLLYSGENARYLERPGEDEIKGVVETWHG